MSEPYRAELEAKLAEAEKHTAELEETIDLQQKTLRACLEARNRYEDRVKELESLLIERLGIAITPYYDPEWGKER